MTADLRLGEAELDQLATDGFVRLDGFAPASVTEAMLAHVVDVVRADARPPEAVVLPEQQHGFVAGDRPEDAVSKVFRLARQPAFHDWITSPPVVEVATRALGLDDVDCFLSQFIFKNPGAWGQPWHQDSFYFPFDPPRPVIGLWLAVTEATLANGCLHVLPGSHHEPVHDHVRDARPGANLGYVEIVDHDMAGAVPVLMAPGDLLVFDSHLMHRSTDNETDGIRAAMVFHLAAAGTVDRSLEAGLSINDWLPVARGGEPVTG